MQDDNGSYGSASELLDGHVLRNGKRVATAMDRSTRTSLDANSVEIGEITESPDAEYMSTSAILHYCKSKILLPYLRLLTIMGLRPVLDTSNSSWCAICFSHYHTLQVALLMLLGYVLQYMACFRRDRGFCYKLVPLALTSSLEYDAYNQVCYGNVPLTYIGPSILHFLGFLYALYLFRVSDSEQLQNLMERVFLMSSYAPQGTPSANPRRLLRTLWLFIILSVLWMCLSLCCVNLMMAEGGIMFKWLESSPHELRLALKVLLVACTLAHDAVQATVTGGYCLQAQLLQAHLVFLRERLLNRSLSPLHWMREVGEFRKLLRYLNAELAGAAGLFCVANLAWALAGLLWLAGADAVDAVEGAGRAAGALALALWAAAALAPLLQAARLSRECRRLRGVGHALSCRPFVHQDTPATDVAAVLLFASSLRLEARLFRFPVVGKFLCLALALAAVLSFALGMCHFLQ